MGTRFAYSIQSPDRKVCVAVRIIGLVNKSRSTDFEWYERNVAGRVMHAIAKGAWPDMAIDSRSVLGGCCWRVPPQKYSGSSLQKSMQWTMFITIWCMRSALPFRGPRSQIRYLPPTPTRL